MVNKSAAHTSAYSGRCCRRSINFGLIDRGEDLAGVSSVTFVYTEASFISRSSVYQETLHSRNLPATFRAYHHGADNCVGSPQGRSGIFELLLQATIYAKDNKITPTSKSFWKFGYFNHTGGLLVYLLSWLCADCKAPSRSRACESRCKPPSHNRRQQWQRCLCSDCRDGGKGKSTEKSNNLRSLKETCSSVLEVRITRRW